MTGFYREFGPPPSKSIEIFVAASVNDAAFVVPERARLCQSSGFRFHPDFFAFSPQKVQKAKMTHYSSPKGPRKAQNAVCTMEQEQKVIVIVAIVLKQSGMLGKAHKASVNLPRLSSSAVHTQKSNNNSNHGTLTLFPDKDDQTQRQESATREVLRR